MARNNPPDTGAELELLEDELLEDELLGDELLGDELLENEVAVGAAVGAAKGVGVAICIKP